MLKSAIAEISGQYPYVVLDNEAGLENLSRRIVQEVDTLIMVSDPSNAGLSTLLRLHALSGEMQIKYKKLVLVVNRLRNGLPTRMEELAQKTGADIAEGIPDDAELARFMEAGQSFMALPEENATVKIIDNLLGKIL